jgi:ribulose-5-phosphate 4-epimerase/fuculose-1-phosphate aldolase
MARVAEAVRSVRDRVSAEEWQVRIDLAACYRLCNMLGWEDLIFTHISARVPGTDGQYLINPYGLLFDEVTASSLVKIAADGAILEDAFGLGYNPGGFTIHGAVHEGRADAHCVIHLHTVHGVAVSCQRDGLLPLQQGAMMIAPGLAYHDYEGIALDLDERSRLIANLGERNHMILRNHGLLTVGATVGQAFARMYALDRACEIQIAAQAGNATIAPAHAVLDKVTAQGRPAGKDETAALAWQAYLRRLDRKDASYKT